jgi:tetratricopeptide (TPR) repeat protein
MSGTIYDTHPGLWNNSAMKTVALFVVLVAAAPVQAGQATQPAGRAAQPASEQAQAYEQFLLARRHEEDNQTEAAIAAYKRAMALDPKAPDIVAELADLYMRENRGEDALRTAEDALRLDPAHREANRVLGTIYAGIGTADTQPRRSAEERREYLTRAIGHLERATVRDREVQADANLRAMLARLYIAVGNFDKAIPMLADLVREEPQWQDGQTLLVEAYGLAGRTDEAVKWLEQAALENPQLYSTLADFLGRAERWSDAAAAYEQALRAAPKSFDLRVRFASMLLNSGGREQTLRARDVLREALTMRATDERALYLLAQAERRSGDVAASVTTARRLIAQNARNPRGHVALAEALEERREYRAVVDALVPAVEKFRGERDPAMSLGMLLPHLGFAYQQVGEHDNAIATFEEARRLQPKDQAITSYLIQANLAAKRYDAAIELARVARLERPDDLRLAQLEAQALTSSGKSAQAIASLEELLRKQDGVVEAHLALARVYAGASKEDQAVKVLRDAQTRFPDESVVLFELGSVLERQKKYSDAEAAFRQLLAREPAHAPALNYLGYMLADRGVRLSESVELIKRALEQEPENGSYLDSLGWAYYKDGKYDLALEPLRRAAEQLTTNSVVQDHYGDLLLRLGKVQDAIDRWNQALNGDNDSVERGEIERKIRSAREKLPRR